MTSLLLAGRDTTAATLTWMVYCLAKHPAVQRSLQAEIDHVCAGNKPSWQDLKPEKMPYLECIYREVLRLYPPVPYDPKYVSIH